MKYKVINLGKPGLVLGDVTIVLKTLAAGFADLSQAGITLDPLFGGTYALGIPAATIAAPAYFHVRESTDPARYAEGVVSPVDGDEARESTPVTVAPAQIAAGVLDATVVVADGAVLRIKQGDVKLYTFEFGAQWDCTGGKRVFFTVKKRSTDAAAALSKECSVTVPATAGGSLSLVAADTAALAVGEYAYEFKRRDADGVSSPGTIQEGKFIIGQDLS